MQYIHQLAAELHYQDSTVEALLYGKRDLTAQGLSALLKLLRKKGAITGFDAAWEFVEVLRSVEHLAVVREVFEPPPFVQMAPRPPASAVERAEEEGVWQELLAGTGPVVVWGMPGVGKSVLAQRVAHRREVRALFPDGVLWTSLEPGGQAGDWLDVWAQVLGVEGECRRSARGDHPARGERPVPGGGR